MAVKEIQEIKKIIICDNCKNEKKSSIHYESFKKDLCFECWEPLAKEEEKKCKHEYYIRATYWGLYLHCTMCIFRAKISEEDLQKNKVIINEIKKLWEKKEGKK